MSLPAYITADGLELTRRQFTKTLTVPCVIYRPQKDGNGISTGVYDRIRATKCGVSMLGATTGGSANPFILSFARVQTLKTPGTRTISFAWDEDVKTDDWLYLTSSPDDPPPTNTDKIVLGTVSKDDPLRYGLQVPGEIERAPA